MAYIINFIGAPGVGKTYLAERLSERMGIFFFDRDVMYDHIFGEAGEARQSSHYRLRTGPVTGSIWDLAIANAKRDVSTILESPMKDVVQGEMGGSWGEILDNALVEGEENGFTVSLIYCVAPEQIIREQIKRRGVARDELKFHEWEQFVGDFVDVPGPKYRHLKIDTTQPTKENLDQIALYARMDYFLPL